ncbi:MAG: hypothetical protein ACE5DX_03420 [Candidatus Dojkabacteria bacterium]
MTESNLDPLESQLETALGWVEHLKNWSGEQYLYGEVFPTDPLDALTLVTTQLEDFFPGQQLQDPLFGRYYKRDPSFTAAADIVKVCERFIVIFNSEGNPDDSVFKHRSLTEENPEFELYQAIMCGDTIFQLKDLIEPLIQYRQQSGILVDGSLLSVEDEDQRVNFMIDYEETITSIVRSIFMMLGYEFDV